MADWVCGIRGNSRALFACCAIYSLAPIRDSWILSVLCAYTYSMMGVLPWPATACALLTIFVADGTMASVAPAQPAADSGALLSVSTPTPAAAMEPIHILDARAPQPSTVSLAGYSAVGCFQHGSNHILTITSLNDSGMTPQLCRNICSVESASIFGVEFGMKCYCGNEIEPFAVRAPDDECTATCFGASNYVCGARSRINVYAHTDIHVSGASLSLLFLPLFLPLLLLLHPTVTASDGNHGQGEGGSGGGDQDEDEDTDEHEHEHESSVRIITSTNAVLQVTPPQPRPATAIRFRLRHPAPARTWVQTATTATPPGTGETPIPTPALGPAQARERQAARAKTRSPTRPPQEALAFR